MDRHRAMMAGVTAGESISFDKVAAIYDATRGGLERGIRFAAAVAPHCGPGPVFEIGVGTGAIAKPLRDRLGRTVLGADLSGEMLTHARARLGPAVVRSDAARLPLGDGSVGTVLACWVLHLVGDAEATLRDVRRVLAADARVVVVSSRGELEPDDVDDAMVDLHDVLRGRVDVPERLIPLARSCGLALVTEELTDPGTWPEAPLDMIERLERRQWGVLIDLDDERFATHVQPVIDRLRALPDPARPRTRIGRHRLFVFRPA
jgi:SAM-dependent methyltransferase